jgi:hypothetical protein
VQNVHLLIAAGQKEKGLEGEPFRSIRASEDHLDELLKIYG